jgi:glycosyltransferase involved in cell wall biosynthesis
VSALKLRAFLADHKIDLIHSHSRTTQVLGCLVSRMTGVAHISTCHGFFKNKVFRRLFPCWGRRVIAISEQVKGHLIGDFKIDPAAITVINNGIETGRFCVPGAGEKLQAKKELHLSDGPVIGIVARLSDVKGHAYLIQAMKRVIEKFPLAQLLIAGEGKIKEELIAAGKRHGIQANVFFVPEIEDTRVILYCLDIFVLPSIEEGLGLALMEAMCCGVPAIGSNIGGIPTLIKDRDRGLLVPPKDVDGLSKAIISYLQDPDTAQGYARNARAFILQNFSHEKMIDQTERMYRDVVG